MQSQNSLDALISSIGGKNNDQSTYEEDFAQKLDENLENYGEKLMDVPISSLVNIFNHPKRKLTKHNLAYQLIIDHSEKKNDSNIFILLKYLDGSKLSSENMMDAFQSKDDRSGFIPFFDFSLMFGAIAKVKSLEETIVSLKNTISTEVSEKLKQYNDEIKELNSNEIESLRQKIDDHLNSFISQNQKEKEQYQTEIKEKQNKSSEELKRNIDEQIKELKKKFEAENELLKKELKLEISAKENNINSLKTSLESQIDTICTNNKNTMASYKEVLENKLENFTLKNEKAILNLESDFSAIIKKENENHSNDINSLRMQLLNNMPITFSNVDQKIEDKISMIKQTFTDDMSKLEQSCDNKIQLLENDISALKKTILDEIQKNNDQNKNEITSLKSNLSNDISTMKKTIADEIQKNNDQNRNEISSLESNLSNEISAFKKTIADEIQKNNDQNKNAIASLKSNLSNDILSTKINNNDCLSSIIENHTKEIMSLSSSFKNQKNDMISIKSKQNKMESIESELNTVKSETKLFKKNIWYYTNDGILGNLKKSEKDQFDKLFVASQSSNDIYNLINPNTSDYFDSVDGENNFIEFNLKDTISINGITIYSYKYYYPKSFDIYIDDNRVYSESNAYQLNGEDKSMTINFSSRKGNKLKIIQTGKNWSGNHRFTLKRIEILSSDCKYSGGVFKTLIDQSPNHDIHKYPLIISSPEFDHNNFHLIDSTKCIGIYKGSDKWFQVELTKGKAEIMAFRLGRNVKTVSVPNSNVFFEYTLKSFKIIGTDVFKDDINSWTTLLEINEKSKADTNLLEIYPLPSKSAPIKYIRIILTGPSFENDHFLIFYHFDFFGVYINQ